MLENTSAVEASSVLGGEFINISTSGGNIFERSMILSYAIKKKNLKAVLYSLDSHYIHQNMEKKKKYPLKNYAYLYDNNVFNDINLYMNDKFIRCLIKYSDGPECVGIAKSLDRPTAWYRSQTHIARFGGLDKWLLSENSAQAKRVYKRIVRTSERVKRSKKASLKDINKRVDLAKQYMDKYLLNIIKQNPNTEFILFFPPYSRLEYSMWAQYSLSSWEIHKAIIRHLVDKSSAYNNIKIFAWGNYDFLDNLANYKDPGHYHYSINSWMLRAIQEKVGLLDTFNVEGYINDIERRALNYDLIGVGEKIKQYTKKSKDNKKCQKK